MEIVERFEKFSDEYGCFKNVENKRSKRRDLHAFILLDEKFPDGYKIVDAAEHDEIYLGITTEQAETLTDDEIIELSRCGVRYSEYGLCMFA